MNKNFKGTYVDSFVDAEDVAASFADPDIANHTIIFANYDTSSWQGDAFVLSVKDNTIYRTYGSHCSCYGLEGQWEPEAITYKELQAVHKEGMTRGLEAGSFEALKNYLAIN